MQEGLQKGRDEGLLQARQIDILDALTARFGALPDAVQVKIGSMTAEAELRRAHRLAITTLSIEQFLQDL